MSDPQIHSQPCSRLPIYFSSDIPQEPPGAFKLLSARVRAWPGVSPLRCPIVVSPPVLINTLPSPNPQNWIDCPPLFPWDQNLEPLLHTSSALTSHSIPWLGSTMLPFGLPSTNMPPRSYGSRDLIYREGSWQPPLCHSLTGLSTHWRQPALAEALLASHFPSSLLWLRGQGMGERREGHPMVFGLKNLSLLI